MACTAMACTAMACTAMACIAMACTSAFVKAALSSAACAPATSAAIPPLHTCPLTRRHAVFISSGKGRGRRSIPESNAAAPAAGSAKEADDAAAAAALRAHHHVTRTLFHLFASPASLRPRLPHRVNHEGGAPHVSPPTHNRVPSLPVGAGPPPCRPDGSPPREGCLRFHRKHAIAGGGERLVHAPARRQPLDPNIGGEDVTAPGAGGRGVEAMGWASPELHLLRPYRALAAGRCHQRGGWYRPSRRSARSDQSLWLRLGAVGDPF